VAGIDVGGVEYLVGARDGRTYFYDVNATSNFVANAPAVLGFDPTPLFVDYIVAVAQRHADLTDRGASAAARGAAAPARGSEIPARRATA
jgi:hypothetical protein